MKFDQAWGFSKLDVFRACKAKFMYQFIKKMDSGGSPAMERGQKMHENIEAYLNGWEKTLTPEVLSWKIELDNLKTKDFKAEQALGFDKAWNKLPDWFNKATWLRVKMDASFIEGTTGTAIDFKSGKYRIPSEDQIELYAISLHAANPELTTVKAQFWFLDTGDIHENIFTADALLKLRKKYEQAVLPMYAEETWPPEPSRDCRWCPYSKTKGGPCQY